MSLVFTYTYILHLCLYFVGWLLETTLVHIQFDMKNYRDITTFTLFCHGKICTVSASLRVATFIKKCFHSIFAVIYLYSQVGLINKWCYYKLLNARHSWKLNYCQRQKMLRRNKRPTLNKVVTVFSKQCWKIKIQAISSVFLCYLYWNCDYFKNTSNWFFLVSPNFPYR